MGDITVPRILDTQEKSYLKRFKELPKDVQYEIMFRGIIWVHPRDLRKRLALERRRKRGR